ncbi:MAG: 4'-phosphopantetheinyl transferase superfamily protein [Candidatus Levyibacteriota bacterium]
MKIETPIPAQFIRLEMLSSEVAKGMDRRWFTQEEIESSKRKDVIREESLSGKLAVKLGVSRILGVPVPLSDIQIGKHKQGDPFMKLEGEAFREATRRGINSFAVSISHDEGIAVGFVVGDTGSVNNLRVGVDCNADRQSSRLFARPERAFTEAEIKECNGDPDLLKNRWAVKEAVAKILVGNGNPLGVKWRTAETYMQDGRMQVRTYGETDALRRQFGINEWHIAVERRGRISIAVVVGHA